MEPTVIVALIAAVAAPLGAYLLAVRRMSGKIATSDASDLWAESRSIRDDYRERLLESSERASRLEARVAVLEGTNTELGRLNAELSAKVASLEALVVSLRETITALQSTIETQRDELEKE